MDPKLGVQAVAWIAPSTRGGLLTPEIFIYIGAILGIYGSIIGIMEKKIETLGPFKGIYIYRDYIGVILGIMENTMETTIVYWGYIGVLLCSGLAM